MATQSTLTITGIGGDPSGSHPIGNLNVNWTELEDDAGTQYTAGTIMADPGATAADATDTYYSEVLCLGPPLNGAAFNVGDTGNAQITTCWEWYNPATSGVDADFVMSADGKTGTFGNGTWLPIGALHQNYAVNYLTTDEAADALAMAKGTMYRVKMVVADAGGGSGGDGVAAGIVTTAVDVINSSGTAMSVPHDKGASYNLSIIDPTVAGSLSTAGSIGGIGADPS